MKSILDGTYLFLRDEKDKWIQEMDQTWTAVTFPKVEYLIYPIIQKWHLGRQQYVSDFKLSLINLRMATPPGLEPGSET
jgi:hypothetical protein